jgi:eukaryotic-like serine/threonine-protein kinase
MHVRCPHCHNPTELVDDSSFDQVDCPSCGSCFSLAADAPTSSFRSADNKTIGHFQLIEVIGVGHFGAVWKARDTELDRIVAIKIPRKEQLDEAESEQFLREARAAAQLRHPNIVSVHEVGREDGTIYIASDYVQGADLKEWLTGQRLTSREAAELCQTICEALHHAHEQGIVHRDLKPGNIMLDLEGAPHIMDFGLAKRDAGEITMTIEGQVLGTPAYMSPEQARGEGHRADRRADIYSMGVILYELLTGAVPFRGDQRMLIVQILTDEPTAPRRIDSGVPRDLETICLKCLQKDPSKRYETAQELADDLRHFQRGETILARPVSAMEKGWRWCLRHRAVTGLLLGLFASLSLGLIGVSFFGLQSAANARLANQRLYRSEMNLAAQHLSNGNIGGVRRTLGRFEASDELSEFRKFEWQYHKTAIAPFLHESNLSGPVIDVTVFPDGKFCAACGSNREIRVWNTGNGDLIRTLSLETGRFQSIDASPTSGQVASGSTDGTVRVWSPLKHDRPILQIKHGPPVALVRFSPNGKWLLSAGARGALRIWNVDDESRVAQIPTGMSGLKDARYSPDGKSLFVATKDGRVRMWDIESQSAIKMFEPNPFVESLAVSDDGLTIATGSFHGYVRLWSVPEGILLDTHETSLGTIGDLEFLKGTSVLAIPTVSGVTVIYDVEAQREIRSLTTHNLTKGIIARSANGKVLAVGSGGGSVKLLDVANLTRADVFWHDEHVRDVEFLPGGKRLIAAGGDAAVSLWNIDNGESQQLVAATDESLTCMSVQRTGQLVALGGTGSRVSLRNRETGKIVHEIDLSQAGITAMAFSSTGEKLVVACGEGKLVVFNSTDWITPTLEATPHESKVNSLVFSPNDREITVAYEGGDVLFLDAVTGKPGSRKIQLPATPLTMTYCEEGHLLAIGTEAGEVHFCEAASGKVRQIIRAHTSRVNVLVAFPDGRTIVSGGRDKVIKLWDAATGELRTTMFGHRRQIFCIAISADGETIASGGLAGDIRIWRSHSAP